MTIHWDETESHTLRPGSCAVSATREEISLVFDPPDPLQQTEQQPPVSPPERVVLSPFTAKKLAVLLEETISRFDLHGGAESPDALIQLVKSLGVGCKVERSVKIIPGKILSNRLLLGISKKNIPEDANAQILDLCGRMGIPENFRRDLGTHIAGANFIHFGYEEEEGICLNKVYLEFLDKVRAEIGNDQGNGIPRLLYKAFKWDVSGRGTQAVTDYTLHPWLPASEMISRAASTLNAASDRDAMDILDGIVGLAAERISPHDLLYLEVTEEGNSRKSFDLNMYRRGLQVAELYPLLGKIARRLGISYKDFHNAYERIKFRKLGHVAGGKDRYGREFFTLYYGVENLRTLTIRPESAELPRTAAGREIPPSEGEAFLVGQVKTLGAPFRMERSFKVSDRMLLGDRLLLVFRRKGSADQDEGIMDICRRLNMPQDFCEAFRQSLPRANFVLMGHEGNPANPLYKAYLEFGDRLADAVPGNQGKTDPYHIFTGFKWSVQDSTRKTMTSYTCFPFLPVDSMLERLAYRFYPPAMRPPGRIVEQILAVAASRTQAGAMLYIEASEKDNPRSSFDVNVYRANLNMMEVYPFLLAVMHHFSAPLDVFHSIYDGTKNAVLGNLAGGTDREGKDFLTFYFSEKGNPR